MEGATQEMRDVARRRIRKQVDRLSNMINELLEFTRGTKTSIVLAPTHYGTFVKQLIDEIRPEAAEKSVALVLTTPPPDVQLLLDPQRLTHVFYNLIHNAIDFMPNGGKIMFRFTVTDKEVATEVEDTGSGIDPAIAGRLFQPFATHGKAHGTGLGLSICQRIILDHRGQIRAHSEPGHGAVFTFTLPRPAQAS
jgi:signal transduction histidine kinase